MTDTDLGASPEAATTAAPNETSDEAIQVTPGADSAPAKLEPLDPDFNSDIENVQKKFNKLTEHRRSAERRAEDAERQARALTQLLERNRQEVAPKPEPVADTKPKTLADFEYDEVKYQSYLFDGAEKRAVEAAERRLKEQSDRETTERRKATFNQREQDFAKDKPDYHEKTRDQRVPITPAMAEVFGESQEGPALAYYLASNIPIAEQIARLPPLMAAVELGRIESKLLVEREKAKEAARKVSQAPPPPSKVDAVEAPGSVSPTDPASDKLSDDAWVRLERAREAKKLRRAL